MLPLDSQLWCRSMGFGVSGVGQVGGACEVTFPRGYCAFSNKKPFLQTKPSSEAWRRGEYIWVKPRVGQIGVPQVLKHHLGVHRPQYESYHLIPAPPHSPNTLFSN